MAANEENITLEKLNSEERMTYIGGAIFVGVLMFIGVIGNVHVLLIYTLKVRPSNHRLFILCLAVLDMITSTVGMPSIIMDWLHPLDFGSVIVCKILRFNNYFMSVGSSFVLVVIAVERYRKICTPHGKQMSLFGAKVSIGLCLCAALCLSWPAFVLYGHNTVETRVDNITGIRCFTDDKFKDTNYQAIFNIVLIVLVLSIFLVLVILYSFVARVIRQRHVAKRKMQMRFALAIESVQTTSRELTSITGVSETQVDDDTNMKRLREDNDKLGKDNGNVATLTAIEPSKPMKTSNENSTRRMTLILFTISAVYFLSFIPHLTLKTLAFFDKQFVKNMSFTGQTLYNIFVLTFLCNNVANPIIYGLCDNRFREHLQRLYCG